MRLRRFMCRWPPLLFPQRAAQTSQAETKGLDVAKEKE
jgi:hypothetical protein